MSVGFLDHRKLARALAADPRLGLIAADRQRPDDAGSNPIEVLRAACAQIKRSTGDRRPRSIMMHQAVYERYREWYIENIARAERLLGIGCAAQGAFPTGWPWTKRAGRMSREEKQLRDYLPGWRRTLAEMPPSKPIKASNGGMLLLASAADDIGDRLAVLLAGDRGGGKTMLINEARESLSKTADERLHDLFAADPARWRSPNSIAMHEQTWREYERTRAAWRTVRRPTGKRAQRRAGKEWNR